MIKVSIYRSNYNLTIYKELEALLLLRAGVYLFNKRD